jgi:hypothetical protein
LKDKGNEVSVASWAEGPAYMMPAWAEAASAVDRVNPARMDRSFMRTSKTLKLHFKKLILQKLNGFLVGVKRISHSTLLIFSAGVPQKGQLTFISEPWSDARSPNISN